MSKKECLYKFLLNNEKKYVALVLEKYKII